MGCDWEVYAESLGASGAHSDPVKMSRLLFSPQSWLFALNWVPRCSSFYKCSQPGLALLQLGMSFSGSDSLLEIKAVLPFKVVAVGRFSELECALQSCNESAHGCDFEKKGGLTLKIIEDGNSVLGVSPDVPLSWSWMATLSTPLCFCTAEIGPRGKGTEPEVAEWKSHDQQNHDFFL